MKNPVFRTARSNDISSLRALWLTAWPQDETYAECFFSSCFSPEDAYAADLDGNVRSMFFSLKGYTYHAGDQTYPASYLYALATDPNFQGKGLGSSLTMYAAEEDHRQSIDFVCLNPANSYLREWYRISVNAKDCFRRRRIEVCEYTDGQLEKVTKEPSPCHIRKISPEMYHTLRNELLKDTCHMEIPMSVLRLQADFCRLAGGGLYCLDIDGRTGICLGDTDGSHLILRELLCPEIDPKAAAASMARELSCRSATAFTPVFWHPEHGTIEPTCMLLPGGDAQFPDNAACPYWGFLMD